jgi:uncharacterized protein
LVVKLIDVYLDEVAGQLNVGGYQITGTVPKPIEANESLSYRFALPTTNHVFLPGHRIMVQVQSSWFPLYDRNPRTFVHLLGQAGGLPKSDAAYLPLTGAPERVELPIAAK